MSYKLTLTVFLLLGRNDGEKRDERGEGGELEHFEP